MTSEELRKRVKLIAQTAWSVETNTTVNALTEYIVKESLEQIILPELEALREEIEELKNGSTERRVSQPKGRETTKNSSTRSTGSGEHHVGAN